VTTVTSGTLADLLRDAKGRPPLPTRAEREPWERLHGARVPQKVLALAEEALKSPPPPLYVTDYLAFRRSGQREPWEGPVDARRDRLVHMVLGECLEAKGRFLDAILNEAWAICEESTWVVSAHAGEYPHGLPDVTYPLIDLWSAMTAFQLAETDYLLGEALHPALRARVRLEVRRRSTEAFLARDDFRWLGKGRKSAPNWTPVCAGGTACAALYLEEDLDTLAAVLAKALAAMQDYLATFAPDGACAEGVAYWEKGFGYFTMFADLLAARTEGKLELFDAPHVRRVAAFPPQVELSPGCFAPFSDTGLARKPQWALLHYLAERLRLPELAALDYEGAAARRLTTRYPPEKVRDLFWYPQGYVPRRIPPPASSYFADIQWLVARADPHDPDSLVLAAKAGHNGEPHNHNDVGSFIVHYRSETLLAELGAGRYTRDYFRPETRYTFLPNRSLGHSVPLVNGCEQGTGARFRAQEVRHFTSEDEEGLESDLTAAYPPEAGLEHLERRVTLTRSPLPSSVTFVDTARFKGVPNGFEGILISFAAAQEVRPGVLRLEGTKSALLIHYDPDELKVSLEVVPKVDLRAGPRDVTRLRFAPKSLAQEVRVALHFIPTDLEAPKEDRWR